MSLYIVDIHGEIEGDYEIVRKYEEQEPMVEIDLDYVIKQKYIEREVLDKIRTEIEELDYITFDGITKKRCLEIIDKYKAEQEEA